MTRTAGIGLAAMALMLAACAGTPSFDVAAAPDAPDYRQSDTWLALPGRNGPERSLPEGVSPVPEVQAPADVFFIHPTTTTARDVPNAPWDLVDDDTPLNGAVLINQAAVFNGCCRIYAPRYRQATLSALGQQDAVDLAYADVAAAFREFVANHNNGRPFIIASHSQGTMHAVRLVQAEVMGTPLQRRMVAAYLIGGYAPDAFPLIGLPICDAPDQTGCVLSWNASKPGSATARIVISGKSYWWEGAVKTADAAPAICVNPLTWRAQGGGKDAPPALNPGSMPLPRPPHPAEAMTLPPLTPHLTGARCFNGMLEVDLIDAPASYGDGLTRLAGSYHLIDYGLFYAALRQNAVVRVQAWLAAQ